MKKQIKIVTTLSATAMMALATPFFVNNVFPASIVYAAEETGWIQEDGGWRYKDSDDYYLTDSWKKRDGDWYYLNEEGYMSTNQKIDEYYVGEDGKRVNSQWITLENEDNWDSEAPDEYWYYFGKDGKAIVGKWQTIEEKSYYFNDEGHMQTGMIEVDGETYYTGEEGDGVKKTGWIQMENQDMDLDADYIWYYFDRQGRMIKDKVDYKIEGNYYTFANGILQTGWYKLPAAEPEATASDAQSDESEAAVTAYQYYEEDGKRASGWYEIEGAPGLSESGETYKFYFKNGKAYAAASGIQMFTISSKVYGFNTNGEMQTGLQTVTLDDGTTANAYFNEDGVAATGKQMIYSEEMGEEQTWFFHTEGTRKGLGFNGVRDNTIYQNGLCLQASSDLRFAPVELDGNRYLVNTSGAIQKASASSKSQEKADLGKGFKDYKDTNDTVWVVNTDGIIQ